MIGDIQLKVSSYQDVLGKRDKWISSSSSARIYCPFFLTLLLSLSLFAQSDAALEGTVRDQITKKPLPNVNVIIRDTHLGAATDSLGYFIIRKIPPELHIVEISHVGYKTKYRTINLEKGKTVSLELFLEPTAIQLKEITVTDTASQIHLIHRYPGSIVITREDIVKSGEKRLSKVMQQLAPRFDLYATRLRSRRSPRQQPIQAMLIIDGVRVRIDQIEFILYDPDYLDKFVTAEEIDHIIVHRNTGAWLQAGRRGENLDWVIEITRRKIAN